MNALLLDRLCQLEAELHRPEVRADAQRVQTLLHADFEEIGRSGRVWSRSDTLFALAQESPTDAIATDRFHVAEITPGAALLTYRSAQRAPDGSLSRHTLRSSLWLLVSGRWQLRFHQGTPSLDIW